MLAANLNSTLYISSSHPQIASIIVVAKENTPFDWTFTCQEKHLDRMACHPRRFPRILSVCILSTAFFLDCFRLLSKTFSRPFSSCFSCISMHIRLWRNLVRQAFQSGTSSQKKSFLRFLFWRLLGVCILPSAQARFDDWRDSTCHRKKNWWKYRRAVRQTKCISFSYKHLLKP